MDVTLNGTHGTALYHAENIVENGFLVPDLGEGKAGVGLYFWFYINQNKHAVKLSKHWWEFAKSKDIYDKKLDCSLRIFDVEIDVSDDNILDFVENFEIYEKFLHTYADGEPEKEYGAKLDLFIRTLEGKLGIKFDLVKINLSVPRLKNVAFANSYPALILKAQRNIRIKKLIKEDELSNYHIF